MFLSVFLARQSRMIPGVVETYVALPAHHLIAVVLGGQRLERGLDDTATETEDQVEGALLQSSYHISICLYFTQCPPDSCSSHTF